MITLLRMEMLLLRRNWTAAAIALVTPLVFGFLLARGFGDDDVSGIAGVAAAIGMAAAFVVHHHLTAVFATRRQEGVLQRLRAGIPTDRTIGVGIALGGAAVFAAQAVGFGVLVLGQPWPAHPLTVLVGLVGVTAVLAALAAALSGLTRTSEAALLTTLPTVTLMLATPGVIVPAAHVGALPYAIGWSTPLGAATALLREGWLGGPGTSLFDALPAAGVLLGWLAAALLLASRFMRWAPRRG